MMLAILLASCSHEIPKQQEVLNQETPKILQEEKSEIKIRSSYESDLLEELYAELSEKNPNLKKINDQIEKHNGAFSDSLTPLKEHKGKSQTYYYSAHHKIGAIKDSTLRVAMMKMVKLSEMNFNNKLMPLEKLAQTISDNSVTIGDQYNVLKIVTTLKSMQKFQKDFMVNGKSLLNVIKEQEQIIAELKKLAK